MLVVYRLRHHLPKTGHGARRSLSAIGRDITGHIKLPLLLSPVIETVPFQVRVQSNYVQPYYPDKIKTIVRAVRRHRQQQYIGPRDRDPCGRASIKQLG